MIAGNAFYGCFYRHGRTVTYVDDSGSQRRAPPFVRTWLRVRGCVHVHCCICICSCADSAGITCIFPTNAFSQLFVNNPIKPRYQRPHEDGIKYRQRVILLRSKAWFRQIDARFFPSLFISFLFLVRSFTRIYSTACSSNGRPGGSLLAVKEDILRSIKAFIALEQSYLGSYTPVISITPSAAFPRAATGTRSLRFEIYRLRSR